MCFRICGGGGAKDCRENNDRGVEACDVLQNVLGQGLLQKQTE